GQPLPDRELPDHRWQLEELLHHRSWTRDLDYDLLLRPGVSRDRRAATQIPERTPPIPDWRRSGRRLGCDAAVRGLRGRRDDLVALAEPLLRQGHGRRLGWRYQHRPRHL